MYTQKRKFVFIACLVLVAIIVFIGTYVVVHYQASAQINALNTTLTNTESERDALEKKVTLYESGTESFDYQTKYPDLFVDTATAETPFAATDSNACYLTFDDGPSSNTQTILDALAAHNAHATFFIIGSQIPGNEALLKQAIANGNTLGVHTQCHNYDTIYASVDAYLDDFYQCYTALYEATGVKPTIFRFPGGSINAYNSRVYHEIIAEMTRRGFTYYDWNVSSNDASSTKQSKADIVKAVVSGTKSSHHPIVLMHDAAAKDTTAAAVSEMLDQLQSLGYQCNALDPSVLPVTFAYTNPTS